MKFYEVKPARYTIDIREQHKWGLPGVHCPTCGAIWSAGSLSLPCVDLSGHPDAKKLSKAYLEEDFNEFIRLREAVRPLVPEGVELKPGTTFGPATGPAKGTTFGGLTMGFPWMMLARPEGIAALEAEGIRGLQAGPTEYRFRGNPPKVLELQILPFGRAHLDCLPPDRQPPCSTCGRTSIPVPQPVILDVASLPTDRDIFRLADFGPQIVSTERFVEAARRLGFDDLSFNELAGR